MLLFCNDTATTALYTYGHTLSLHVALPICRSDNRLPACLVDHFHAKRLGLGQLAASAGPGNDQIGLGRNRARYLRAKRSEEHTSELKSLMRLSYAVFCLKKKTNDRRLPNSIL